MLLARETGLPFAIKSGGHGVNGHAACDDGIVLDLSPLKKITRRRERAHCRPPRPA